MAEQAEFMQRQYAFAAHIRDPRNQPAPADVEDRRMAIYRELFYNNVEGFLSNTFPVLRRLYSDEAWHAMARDFFARHRCHTPLFLEIPREFLVYLEHTRGRQPGDPAFLWELAHYEWVELALSVSEDEPDREGVDPDGDLLAQHPLISSLAWPLSYAFPVHRISPAFQPTQADAAATQLVVYRGPDDRVGFVELNPVSARLLGLLVEQPTLSGLQALQQIAEELQHPDPPVVINGGLDILQQWHRLGIVIGTRQ